MANINPVGPLQGPEHPLRGKGGAKQPGGASFQDTLNGFLKDVNKMQLRADESIEKMAAGEITDVHQVMESVQEANVSFNMMMEIRNKVMDAYQEILRMRL